MNRKKFVENRQEKGTHVSNSKILILPTGKPGRIRKIIEETILAII
ncbi:MAG: hypothetical protein ACRC2T_09720 [Thermoguttaceae bacterium]